MQVVEPETQFEIDKYTEAALIAKPNIYIRQAHFLNNYQSKCK